jgi:hypothetical protein
VLAGFDHVARLIVNANHGRDVSHCKTRPG